MANHYVKQLSGQCPYCLGGAFGPAQDRRTPADPADAGIDRQQASQCAACAKWSVLDAYTGIRYPTSDPSDPSGPPVQSITLET